jgi:hypothetical protein
MRHTVIAPARPTLLILFLTVTLLPAVAVAQQPEGPMERSVVTQDGAMYRGEVQEYVIGDHITLKLDTGEQKRIAWGDAVQISPPRSKGKAPPKGDDGSSTAKPTPTPPGEAKSPHAYKNEPINNPKPVATVVPPGTERTVTTQDSITYHGEVLEYEVGSHLTLKLATGDKRRIPWPEAKRISPPRTRGDSEPSSASPERTIVMLDGTKLRGELVESLLGDYTVLSLPNGQVRRIEWKSVKRILLPLPPGKPSPLPMSGELLVQIDNGSRIQGEYFEYVPDDHLVLRHASGRFRIIPVGTIKKIVLLGEGGN